MLKLGCRYACKSRSAASQAHALSATSKVFEQSRGISGGMRPMTNPHAPIRLVPEPVDDCDRILWPVLGTCGKMKDKVIFHLNAEGDALARQW